MPPPNTPLVATPIQKLKRGYQTESSAAEDTSDSSSAKPTSEMWQEAEARERVAMILGSWERLSWHSRTYGESIPQTRLRLEKTMIGLEAESGEEEWANEGEGGEKEKEREKERDEKQKRIRRSDGNVRKKGSTAGKG